MILDNIKSFKLKISEKLAVKLSENESLKSQNVALGHKIQTLSQQIEEHLKDISTKDSIATDLLSSRALSTHLNDQLCALGLIIEEKNNTISSLQLDAEKMKEEIDVLNKSNTQKSAEIASFGEILSTEKSSITSYQSEIEDLRKELLTKQEYSKTILDEFEEFKRATANNFESLSEDNEIKIRKISEENLANERALGNYNDCLKTQVRNMSLEINELKNKISILSQKEILCEKIMKSLEENASSINPASRTPKKKCLIPRRKIHIAQENSPNKRICSDTI